MTAQGTSTRGVADIVFLIDATGSMDTCIGELKKNLSTFIDTLVSKDGNNESPVRNWRAKVVGFRDCEVDSQYHVDNPFVEDAETLKSQLAALKADGGGDEPETLLDSLYKVCAMGATEAGAPPDPFRWRHHRDAHRFVFVFTDATFKRPMRLSELNGGEVDDVINCIHANRVLLYLFAPQWPGYDELAAADRSEYYTVGEIGHDPQAALRRYTQDTSNFQKILASLAKSVSKSSGVQVDPL